MDFAMSNVVPFGKNKYIKWHISDWVSLGSLWFIMVQKTEGVVLRGI